MMDSERFDSIIEDTLEQCRNTLINKAQEYATVDRLHNFNTAKILLNCTTKQAIAAMMSKHIISIYDMVNSGLQYSDQLWQEKIGDAINYLLLLKAATKDG